MKWILRIWAGRVELAWGREGSDKGIFQILAGHLDWVLGGCWNGSWETDDRVRETGELGDVFARGPAADEINKESPGRAPRPLQHGCHVLRSLLGAGWTQAAPSSAPEQDGSQSLMSSLTSGHPCPLSPSEAESRVCTQERTS